jgi:DNA-binding NarL/FixJ family response regulator
MKNFLFFDDDVIRLGEFKDLCRNLNHVKVTSAFCPDEAIHLLKRIKFDCAFLDHDMDFGVPGGGDGRTVANYIALHLDPKMYPSNIVIHSWNPEAAKEMKAILAVTKIPTTLQPFRID